jgi:hypothetical protein
MNAKELRIGNLFINPFGDIESVSKIDFINDRLNDFTFNSCKPIPLTEEWPVKFGFEKHGEWYILDAFQMPTGLHISILHNITTLGSNEEYEIPHIKYVHSLQNLYFALTGEVLEIK